MSGFFKGDRDTIKNKKIWENPIASRLYTFLCANAVYKEDGHTYGNIHVQQGQYLRSYRQLQKNLAYMDNRKKCYYSLSQLKRAADLLVSCSKITKLDTELGTLFTIPISLQKADFSNADK